MNGVADVSLLGNCAVHFDVVGQLPASADQPISLKGALTITTADGATTLKADPNFGNFYYHVTFTGGSGRFAAARGEAETGGVALLTSPAGDKGTATWRMKGHVLGNKPGKK